MIRLILHGGETREANDDVYTLEPYGVRSYDTNSEGIRTGEWTLTPWSSIIEVQRFKNKPRPKVTVSPEAEAKLRALGRGPLASVRDGAT